MARDSDFTTIGELDAEEMTALQYEKDHKWHGTKMLWYSIGLCAVGAATQGEQNHRLRERYLMTGWDQTGSNGANLSFPQAFGIDGPGRGEWIVGLINSIIYLTA